jgi:3-oxoacyl-[acyl-carrier protein] reductase
MIIVTGSGSGMGKSVAERLHSSGKEVLGITLNKPTYEPKFTTIMSDVRDIKDLYRISRDLLNSNKQVTGLINCAGIYENSAAGMFFEDKVYNLIDTNLNGVFNSCQAFLQNMNPKEHTSIVNISSLAAHIANEATMYAASKAGVEAFTRGFAKQLSNTKIRANCIAPGVIMSDLSRKHIVGGNQPALKAQIIEHMFEMDDISDLVELLLDKRSNSLTGQTLHVGGL